MRSWWIWRAGIVTLAYRLRSSFPCVRPSHLAASFVGSHEIHRAPHRREQRSSEDVREFVAFVETSTEFGGRRQWFRCLSCGNKCRILYGGAYFRCRRCYRLKYEMQYEPPFGRIAIRALKIRERLRCKGGIGEPFPPKPKGHAFEDIRAVAPGIIPAPERLVGGHHGMAAAN